MNDKIAEQVIHMLNQSGQAISEGTKYSFGVMVKQEIVDGWVRLGAISLLWLLSIVAICVAYKFVKENGWTSIDRWDSKVSSKSATGFYICLGVCGFFTLLLVIIGAQSIMQIVNPEYYAIKDIIDMIHGN